MQNNNKPTRSRHCSFADVFGKLFWSRGLFLVLVVAPALWAFLPFAYAHIKAGDYFIRENPMFLVFARMTVGCVWMLLILLGLYGVSLLRRWNLGRLNPIVADIGSAFVVVKRNLQGDRGFWRSGTFWILILLGIVYVAARGFEMGLILGYGESVFATGNLKAPALEALKDYGYFMGLMLAVPIAFVVNLWRGTNTITSFIFGMSILFLTLASGLLYLCGELPDGVRGVDFFWMSLIAGVVSLLTFASSICKGKGNLSSTATEPPTFWSILISSFTVNLVMSAVAAALAFVASAAMLWYSNGGTNVASGIFKLLGLYWRMELVIPLVLVVGLGATVAAPVAQLMGVSIHDRQMSSLSKYGVNGKNWLMICGGFEPLFVAGFMFTARGIPCLSRVSFLEKCWDHDSVLYSNLLMLMAVLTVVVIALLKIAEVWSEKNSTIRNRIFTDYRGSSVDNHAKEGLDYLLERALAMTFLKFYDKRKEFVGCRVSVSTEFKRLDLPRFGLSDGEVRYVQIRNGQTFFTQDDPFTSSVLDAHAHYLNKAVPGVEAISLKRFLRRVKGVSEDVWKKIKKDIRSANDAEVSGSLLYVIRGGRCGCRRSVC